MNKCIYCDNEAKFQFGNGKWCCGQSMNQCPAIKQKRASSTKLSWDNKTRGTKPQKVRQRKNIYLSPEEQTKIIELFKAGYSQGYIRDNTQRGNVILRRLRKLSGVEYNTKDHQGHKGRMEKTTLDVFVNQGKKVPNSEIIRIIKTHNLIPHEKCWHCGLNEWLDGPLVIELHHIDGNHRNNEIGNLSFLCPNCHSQTHSWKGKNNTGKVKITNEQILEQLQKGLNNNQICKFFNICGAGNYKRLNRLRDTLPIPA